MAFVVIKTVTYCYLDSYLGSGGSFVGGRGWSSAMTQDSIFRPRRAEQSSCGRLEESDSQPNRVHSLCRALAAGKAWGSLSQWLAPSPSMSVPICLLWGL